MKIVINTCFGGFNISKEAKALYETITSIEASSHEMQRDDPVLIKIVEDLGAEANGSYAKLKVVEIPDDVDWAIDEYDGKEWVAEKHRTWS
jgi:hypothetical protein